MNNENKIDVEHGPMPLTEQDLPFDAKQFYEEACQSPDDAYGKYRGYRQTVTGIASKIGPDIHGKPSIEISDMVGGHCYVLAVFPSDDFYSKVAEGDKVTVQANYLLTHEPYGVVMKFAELLKVW